jgi:sulfide dehydrogenase cytochrome subunit
MKNPRKILLSLVSASVFLIATAGLSLADGHLAKAGERLSKTCASCHGTDGASPGKLIPIIGGQKAAYLETTLVEFAAGERPGSVMLNLAKGYSAEEHKQMAAFFASKPWVNTEHAAVKVADASLVKSCQGCHGRNGHGLGTFPRLAGQHPEYLDEALGEYKRGERKAATMMMVRGIDEGTLRKMADYYSALQ